MTNHDFMKMAIGSYQLQIAISKQEEFGPKHMAELAYLNLVPIAGMFQKNGMTRDLYLEFIASIAKRVWDEMIEEKKA